MSLCVKCNNYFHPDFCIETNIRGDNVIICLFCKLDKKSLTIEDKDGKMIEILSKDDAIERYRRYLNELVTRPNISKIISKELKK